MWEHGRDELPLDPSIIGVQASMTRHGVGKRHKSLIEILRGLSFYHDKVVVLILNLVKLRALYASTSHESALKKIPTFLGRINFLDEILLFILQPLLDHEKGMIV